MILRSLAVEGFGRFRNRFEIAFAVEGATVLHGPNGAGKSTLAEALVWAFFVQHDSSSRDLALRRPWGTQLDPSVTVEFEWDGAHYRLHKSFLDSKRVQLERFDAGAWQLFEKGKSVEVRLRGMFGAASQSGVSAETWGLAQVLWTPHRALQLGALSDSLRQTVSELLGAAATTREAQQLGAAIDAEMFSHWTDTGRQHRKNSLPYTLAQQLAEARQAEAEAKAAVEDAAARRREVAELESRRASLATSVESARARLAEAKIQAGQYRELRGQWQEASAKKQIATRDYQALQARIERLGELRRKLESARGSLAEAEPLLPSATQEAMEAQEAATGAHAAVQCASWKEMRRKAEAAHDLQERLAAIDTEANALIAPGASELHRLRKLAQKRAQLRGDLEKALVYLEIAPQQKSLVRVVTGEPAGEHHASASAPLRVTGAPRIEVEIAAWGRLSAGGPSQSADELRAALEQAETEWLSAVAPFPSADLDVLEASAERAAGLRVQALQAQAELRGALGGEKLEDLERQVAAHAAACLAAPEGTLSLQEAQQVWLATQKRAEETQRTVERLQSLKDDALRRQVEAERELAHLDSGAETAAQLQERLTALAIAATAAEAALERHKPQLEACGPDPEAALLGAEQTLDRIEREFRQCESDYREGVGALHLLNADDRTRRLEEAEARAGELVADYVRAESAAAAAKRLREAWLEAEAASRSGLPERVALRASAYLERIAGRAGWGALSLSDSFSPDAFLPAIPAAEEVGLESLSDGEREQAHLAARLALAEALFLGERRLVVLDDVLLATDPARLERVCEVIAELRDRFQFLLLTCDPARYAALPGAQLIDLEAAISGARAVGG